MKHLFITILVLTFISCTDTRYEIVDYSGVAPAVTTTPDYNEDRNAYFGDTHIHTKYSFDAYIFGTTATPDDAYRFAQGEAIQHPLGFDMKIKEPLDFYAVTDHAFFLGMINAWADTSTYASTLPGVEAFHDLNRDGNRGVDSIVDRFNLFGNQVRNILADVRPWWDPTLWRAILTPHLQIGSKVFDHDTHISAWADIVRAAEEANDPGRFTTFTAFFLGMINAWADTSTYASTLPGVEAFHDLNRDGNRGVDSIVDRFNLFGNQVRNILADVRPWWDPTLWRAILTPHLQIGSKVFDHDTHISAWADIVRAAEEANDPGRFTTFTAYEFTTSTDVGNGNLHRNVIFKGDQIPVRPHSRIDSINPENLWKWMDGLLSLIHI